MLNDEQPFEKEGKKGKIKGTGNKWVKRLSYLSF